MKTTALTALALLAFAAPAQAQNFKNCAAAFAAGYWNMKSGEPGYAPKLDRDHDGVACETASKWPHNDPKRARALQAGGFYGKSTGSSYSTGGGY